jgi:parallel beta-helix repeat protein
MSRSVNTASLASALRLAIGATLVFNVSIRAEAATYYVSLSGSDSRSCATAQTIDTPKRTIAAGVACLSAGDTLFIREGTYQTSGDVIDSSRFRVPSGTSWSSAVTIAGYPGETVVIQPPNGVHGLLLTTGAPSYLIFQDFTLDYSRDTTGREGVYAGTGAHHNRFLRLEVRYVKSFGVVFSENGGNSNFNELIDSEIHHTGDGGSDIRIGHGLYILTSDNLFEGNYIHDNEGYGFSMYDDAGPKIVSRNVIRRNRIYNNGLTKAASYAVVLAWGDDNLVYNNLIYANKGGVQVYTESSGAGVYNNTIVGNRDEGIALQYFRTAPTVKNNIVYGNGSAIVNYGGLSGTPVIDHNLTSNPLFVNRTLNNYQLTETSPARDTGTLVARVDRDFANVARPQNGAYDVGAFEYSTISNVPRAVTGVRIFRSN